MSRSLNTTVKIQYELISNTIYLKLFTKTNMPSNIEFLIFKICIISIEKETG